MSKIPSAHVLGIDLIRMFEDQTVSPLASGNDAPTGSLYIGPHAIPWLKTGAGATQWTQELMRAPYFNVKTFGATGDGVTDDRVAIQAAITAAVAAGGGVVFFPAAVGYACYVRVGITQVFSLTTTSSGKIMFLGTGWGSPLIMAGDSQSTDKVLFEISAGAQLVGFKNLYMRSELTDEDEQNHLIQFLNAATATPTGRSFVTDCYFGRTRGDAIRMIGNGAPTPRVADVIIKRNVFRMDPNPQPGVHRARSCVSIQRATNDVTIDMNWLEGASPLDMEPTGTGSIERFRFIRNFCPTAQVAISGNGAGAEDMNTIVVGNTLTDGSIGGGDIGRGIIAGNIVDESPVDLGQNEPNINMFERITQMIIADNLCFRGGVAQPSQSIIRIDNQGPIGLNEGLSVTGNLVINEKDAVDDGCIALSGDANRCNVQHNICMLKTSALNNGVCILVDGGTGPAEDNVISDNIGIGTNARLAQCFQAHDGNVAIVHNLGRNAAQGVRFTNTNEQFIGGRNVLADIAAGAVALTAGVSGVAVDWVSSPLAPTLFQAVTTPQANVVAAIGSIALRSTGGGAGITLYVKEADSGLATGWVAK